MICIERGMYLWETKPGLIPHTYIIEDFTIGEMNTAGSIWVRCTECFNQFTTNKLFDMANTRRNEICISDDDKIFKVVELF